MVIEHIPHPWNGFLSEIDSRLEETIELRCLGGFVLTMIYGLPRTTADMDVVAIASVSANTSLIGRVHQSRKRQPEVLVGQPVRRRKRIKGESSHSSSSSQSSFVELFSIR